jgi:transcriptional regulator with GAF, ATPase, and Fis domain
LPERDRFIAAMEKSGWVQAKAARILGLTPRQIGYALKKHGIEVNTSKTLSASRDRDGSAGSRSWP